MERYGDIVMAISNCVYIKTKNCDKLNCMAIE